MDKKKSQDNTCTIRIVIMRRFLRLIRHTRWFGSHTTGWLNNDVPGDAFGDIQTHDNKLSVYQVDNEQDKLCVITALAACRDNISNLDCTIFDDSNLASLGIKIQPTRGSTPDANTNRLHCDFEHMTMRSLANLAKVISAGTHDRIHKKNIKLMLQDAYNKHDLDTSRIKQGILSHL